jgi:hypothetical protein
VCRPTLRRGDDYLFFFTIDGILDQVDSSQASWLRRSVGGTSSVTNERHLFLNNWRLLKHQRKSIFSSFHGIPNQFGVFPYSTWNILQGYFRFSELSLDPSNREFRMCTDSGFQEQQHFVIDLCQRPPCHSPVCL